MISMAWSQCSRMTSEASQYNGIFAVLQYSVSSIAADSEMQKKVECGFQYYCEHKPSPVSSMSIGDSISSKLMESGSTRGDSENPLRLRYKRKMNLDSNILLTQTFPNVTHVYWCFQFFQNCAEWIHQGSPWDWDTKGSWIWIPNDFEYKPCWISRRSSVSSQISLTLSLQESETQQNVEFGSQNDFAHKPSQLLMSKDSTRWDMLVGSWRNPVKNMVNWIMRNRLYFKRGYPPGPVKFQLKWAMWVHKNIPWLKKTFSIWLLVSRTITQNGWFAPISTVFGYLVAWAAQQTPIDHASPLFVLHQMPEIPK